MNAKEWSIEISAEHDGYLWMGPGSGKAELIGQCLRERFSGALSIGPHSLSTSLFIEAESMVDALVEGKNGLRRVFKEVELDEPNFVAASVMTWDEFERRLEQPTYPRLLGIAEIASSLRVTKQRASQISRSDSFPKPFAELASGPVWFEPDVERFLTTWTRKPGRPSKTNVTQLKPNQVVSTVSMSEGRERMAGRRTSGRAAKAASKVLRDGRTSRASKTAAGSALSQRSKGASKKGKK